MVPRSLVAALGAACGTVTLLAESVLLSGIESGPGRHRRLRPPPPGTKVESPSLIRDEL